MKFKVVSNDLVFILWILILSCFSGYAGQAQSPAQSISSEPSPQETFPPAGSFTKADPALKRQAYLKYLEAHELLEERKIEDAIKAFRDVIRLDPEAAEPHAALGEVFLFYVNRLEDAEREGRLAVRLDADSLNGHRLLARLYIFLIRVERKPQEEQFDRAIREYEQVARLAPGNAEAWAFLADLYEARRDTAKRIYALERWAAAPVSSDVFYSRLTNRELSTDRAYYQLAQLYLANGNQTRAIEASRRAYELEPEINEYATGLIRTLRYAPAIADELSVYEQLSRSADTPALQVGYGAALIRAGRYQEAIRRLQASAARDQSNTSVLSLLSIAQRRAGERSAALATLRQAIAQADETDRLRLQIELAETHEELEQVKDALADYEIVFDGLLRADKSSPGNPLLGDVLTRIVRLCSRTGNLEQLAAIQKRASRELGENDPVLASVEIEILRQAGNKQEALTQTQSAIRRFPEERSFRFTSALLLSETGRYEDSVELLKGLLTEQPEWAVEDSNVCLLLSSVYMQEGKLDQAELYVRKAIRLNPDDDTLLIHLSSVLDKTGHHHDSEKTLRELLQRNPENATALNNLGYFLIARGERLEEAVKLIERAVNIEPTNGNFLDSLGWANYKLGRLEQARIELEKARMYARNDASVHEHLGDVLKELGREQEARRSWEKALQLTVGEQGVTRLKGKLKVALK